MLVPKLKKIGDDLRLKLKHDSEALDLIVGKEKLLNKQSWPRESVQLRNIYIHPLNVLQVELLKREREKADDKYEQAIMVTIAGILDRSSKYWLSDKFSDEKNFHFPLRLSGL